MCVNNHGVWILIAQLLVSEILGKLEPPQSPITPEMQTYLMRTKVSLSNNYDTVGIIGGVEEYSAPVFDYLMQHKNKDAVLTGMRFKPYVNIRGKLTERTKNLFCFINTVANFEEVLAYVTINPFFRLDGFVQFIVGKIVDDKDWLEEKLKLIWKYDILNYVIVYQYKSTVEVMGYNPFNDTIYNYTNHPIGFKIYPEKLKDMHGYQLNIGMFLDIPRQIMVGGRITGEDYNLMSLICEEMNARVNLTIYTDPMRMSTDVREKRLDFSSTRIFTFTNSPFTVEASYPLQIDYLVILVPTAGELKQYKYLFLTFSYPVWICIIVSIVLMVFAHVFFARSTGLQYKSYSDSFIAVMQVFLSVAYVHLDAGRNPVRILLLFWALHALLIVTVFGNVLLSSLLSTKYGAEIEDLEDLQSSDLKVAFDSATFHSVADQFSAVEKQLYGRYNSTEIVDHVLAGDKSMAYVHLLTFATILARRRDAKNRFYFTVLDGYFVAGHNVFNFGVNSPYLDEVNELLLFIKQFRLSLFGVGNLATSTKVVSEVTKLNLKHMQSAYIILACGCGLSALVFIGERIRFRKKFDFVN